MAGQEPVAELDARFSSDNATPTGWAEARKRLEDSEVYWLSTVRPHGRPHVTPLISVCLDGAFHQGTGEALVYEVAPSTAFGFGNGDANDVWPKPSAPTPEVSGAAGAPCSGHCTAAAARASWIASSQVSNRP